MCQAIMSYITQALCKNLSFKAILKAFKCNIVDYFLVTENDLTDSDSGTR